MSELFKLPSNILPEQFVSYISKVEIEKITSALASSINERYQGEELILIGMLKGSTIFLSDLVKKLKNINVYIDFVKIGSIGRDKENSGTMILKKDISTNIKGKNVLIVEEIIDTGRALHFLKERLAQAEPRCLEVVTLFDKPYKRLAPIKADYIGKKLEDQFVVGYGLDLEEYGRNISNIYYLKYPN
jgi:hypoxanthine phosphoribosyltransferase